MFAKLTIYSDGSTPESARKVSQLSESDGLHNWQLIADNLTTGKIMELLMCLDELGFLSVSTDGLAVE